MHLNRTRYSMRNVHDNHRSAVVSFFGVSSAASLIKCALDPVPMLSELATLPLATFFNLYLDKDQLPVVLRPQERQNFVFFVESLPAARAMVPWLFCCRED